MVRSGLISWFVASAAAVRQAPSSVEEKGHLQRCIVDGKVAWNETGSGAEITTTWVRTGTEVTVSALPFFTLKGTFARGDEMSGVVTVTSINYDTQLEAAGVVQGAKKWNEGTMLTANFSAIDAILSDKQGNVTMKFTRVVEERGDLQKCTVDGEVIWDRNQAIASLPTSWVRVGEKVTVSVLPFFTLKGIFTRNDIMSGNLTVTSVQYDAQLNSTGVVKGANKLENGKNLSVRFTATGATLSTEDQSAVMEFNRSQ